ncbi:AzlD domain-containing protein [Salsipaludibacter albus]|uniref:AzlD domain-containing protein n=1 Tax=Salsipaludibacter albus TaxID=2849650 RepID=UPI001EE4B4E8|nr:AzlD domain-containing protein [Salsipaludibacter albus]
MDVLVALLAVALVSWVYRVAFTGLLGGDRLPASVRGRLDVVGPAAFAALVVTDLAGQPAPLLLPMGAAVVAAAITARLTGSHVAAVVVAGLAWWACSAPWA